MSASALANMFSHPFMMGPCLGNPASSTTSVDNHQNQPHCHGVSCHLAYVFSFGNVIGASSVTTNLRNNDFSRLLFAQFTIGVFRFRSSKSTVWLVSSRLYIKKASWSCFFTSLSSLEDQCDFHRHHNLLFDSWQSCFNQCVFCQHYSAIFEMKECSIVKT
jgi:hypothetical protein